MLFNLVLVSMRILFCFCFLCLFVFSGFFTGPVETENARLKLALVIPAGAPMTVTNDAIDMLPVPYR